MRQMGRRGMVASPHYLATQAGLAILRRGGSALDAAIATNAVLAVVTPTSCGIGGDLFALIYLADTGSLTGLNGSGRAAIEATPERVAELAGTTTMPERGPLPINVPGCVEAWGRLHERYGRLPLADLLDDAIYYAEHGFATTAHLAQALERSADFLHPQTPARETFLPDGMAPREGQILIQPRLARSLRAIADRGPDAYYRGPLGQEIVRAVRAVGGLLSVEDFAGHQSNWVDPLSVHYRDAEVFELPPNSQGLVALLMLAMLEQLPKRGLQSNGKSRIHLLAEVARLAYADRDRYLTDPTHMMVEPKALLSAGYAAGRARLVTERATASSRPGEPGDTIYLCTADSSGNLVSLIESNFMGIGSGVMGGETGIMLHNRGAWFSLDPSHANVIAPRKRPMHTLMPGMAFRRGRPWLVFGTMGGSAQAQIHVQILNRLLDQGMMLDEAIDAPRFDAVVGTDDRGSPLLVLEQRFPSGVIRDLQGMGHAVLRVPAYSASMGHAHAIQLLDDGVYLGASDPRAESLALGY